MRYLHDYGTPISAEARRSTAPLRCAAGWLSNSKGYWMDRTVKGCGKGRGFRRGRSCDLNGEKGSSAAKGLGILKHPGEKPWVVEYF